MRCDGIDGTQTKAESKIIGVAKVRPIILESVGVDLRDPAVSELLYFKHDVGASSFCWQLWRFNAVPSLLRSILIYRLKGFCGSV